MGGGFREEMGEEREERKYVSPLLGSADISQAPWGGGVVIEVEARAEAG